MDDHHISESTSGRAAVERWLEAEATGDDAAAERVLGSLFQALPRHRPGRDFADRVLVRAGLIERRTVSMPRFRWGIAAALLFTGSLVILAIPIWTLLLSSPLLRSLIPEQLLLLPLHAWAGLLQHATTYSPLWNLLADLRQAAWLVLTSPPVAVLGLTLIALSLLSVRWIAGSASRRWNYA